MYCIDYSLLAKVRDLYGGGHWEVLSKMYDIWYDYDNAYYGTTRI